jgi:acetyl esterase/lipase
MESLQKIARELISLPAYWIDAARYNRPAGREVRIEYGPHRRQYVLLNIPERPRAWLIYFHGGGWRFGAPEWFRAAARVFADLDIAVALPSHRRTPQSRWPDLKADVREILRAVASWSRYHLGEEFDLLLGGISAGGHLTTQLILDEAGWPAASWSRQQLRGWFACGAVLDFRALPSQRVILSSLVGGVDSPHYQEANPIGLLHPRLTLPPALILHGTQDGMVHYDGARAFTEVYEDCGAGPIQLHTIPGGTHLDSGRWMFADNAERQQLRAFVRRHLDSTYA